MIRTDPELFKRSLNCGPKVPKVWPIIDVICSAFRAKGMTADLGTYCCTGSNVGEGFSCVVLAQRHTEELEESGCTNINQS